MLVRGWESMFLAGVSLTTLTSTPIWKRFPELCHGGVSKQVGITHDAITPLTCSLGPLAYGAAASRC